MELTMDIFCGIFLIFVLGAATHFAGQAAANHVYKEHARGKNATEKTKEPEA